MSNDERAQFEAWAEREGRRLGKRQGDSYEWASSAWGWNVWQARAAIAQQPAKRDDTGRTPTDYALEHAEYMAKGAERFIDAVNWYAKTTTEITEESEVEQAEQSVTEHGRGLRCDIYEFRKRRDRAAIAQPAQQADAQPVAWVRWCSDGTFEGPLMDFDRRMDDVRKKSGAWTPLFAAAPPARQPLTDESSPKPDADEAFKEWVRDMPLHERTPWNVWHAAVNWVRRNG